MGKNFYQLRYHAVFATKHRNPWITEDIQEPVHRYVRGVVEQLDGVLFGIGGMQDHLHLLVGLKPSLAPAKLIKDVKGASSRWISATFDRGFGWQAGYGIFTVSHSRTAAVRRYIDRQEEHHREKSFDQEFEWLLQTHGLDIPENVAAPKL